MKGKSNFKGVNGSINIQGNSIVIVRDNFVGQVLHSHSQRVISKEEVSGVIISFGSLINGYLTIITKNHKPPSGIISAAKDDNSVVFRCLSNKHAAQIGKAIAQMMNVNIYEA